MADIFDKLLESVDSLSREQFEKLYAVMEKRKAKEDSTSKDIRSNDFMPCPNCGSVETKKYGKVRGKQLGVPASFLQHQIGFSVIGVVMGEITLNRY